MPENYFCKALIYMGIIHVPGLRVDCSIHALNAFMVKIFYHLYVKTALLIHL